MEQTSVQKLARVLRVMVIIMFVCNLIALLIVPVLVLMAPEVASMLAGGSLPASTVPDDDIVRISLPVLLGMMWLLVWTEVRTAVLTVFLWFCGICTAVILWQGKRVLDTILAGEPFTMKNAANLKWAAVCCFIISGAALARLVWGLAYYVSVRPLLTYNALFVPAFLVAGLLCMVMSALFRQAAELKAENDLTI